MKCTRFDTSENDAHACVAASLKEAVLNSSGSAAKHAKASGQEYCSSKKTRRQKGRPPLPCAAPGLMTPHLSNTRLSACAPGSVKAALAMTAPCFRSG
jgi:hypothetical protein